MTLFGDIINWLIGSSIDLCREIVVEVWRHPLTYGVTAALLPTLALWGWFWLRFTSGEDP